MRSILLILFITTVVITLSAQPGQYRVDALVNPKIPEQTLTVGGPDADIQGFDLQAIQSAIDAIALTGGTVALDPGTFTLIAPVRLKSNIHLKGSGKETILAKTRGVQTRFIIDADYGELKITVEDPDGFFPGMKIQVTDDNNSSCWNVSTAYVTDIRDDVIYIDDHLIRDYYSTANGLISNASSVVEVIGAENVQISGMTLDGRGDINHKADGCNSAGIYIFKSKKVTVDGVHVKDFNGEGISWQITEEVTIKNSEISGSGNTGLHPGTGSPLTIIENNTIHHNTVDGLFICWRVHHSIVRNNKIHHNGRFGICTGHKDTDVLFDSNHIYENGSDGVNLRGEREANAPHRNTFVNNTIENNGVNGSGYGLSINAPAHDLILKENIFRDTKDGRQKAGVYITENGLMPQMINNHFTGHKLEKIINE